MATEETKQTRFRGGGGVMARRIRRLYKEKPVSQAYRCDNCGQHFDGAALHSHKERVGEFEVTLTVTKAPKPLAETAKEADSASPGRSIT